MELKNKVDLSVGKGASTFYLLPKEWFSDELINQLPVRKINNNFYVPRSVISKALRLINKNIQNYYDRWVLWIEFQDDRPKCKVCGKEATFIKFSKGYRNTCCAKECIKKIDSITQIRLREDPDSIFNTDGFRNSLSKGISNAWKNPNSLYHTESYKNNLKEAGRIAIKKYRADPNSYFNSVEYRNWLSEFLSARNRVMWSDPASTFNSPKFRKLMSDNASRNMLKLWGDAESVFNSSEHRRKLSNCRICSKRGVYHSIKSGDQRYQSSWEMYYMELIDNDSSVTTYTSQPCSVSYYRPDTGKVHRYIPDCLVEFVDGHKLLVEIKPECFCKDELNVLKFKAGEEYAKSQGYEWQVITEKELFVG